MSVCMYVSLCVSLCVSMYVSRYVCRCHRLTEFKSEQVAEQLTLLDAQLFQKIEVTMSSLNTYDLLGFNSFYYQL